ncbi:monocarboxylate transporter 12-like [Rhopalosiphum padi]|uniref:monocarboxylate transporter 12-like n=1 Tax=Rhopalosiphum padi TaxID=40932 RepID=UPI00298E491C|nr:monocarboxylate transporter 12-like [Rhopalosiphum padi]XP_060836958.1 monocarboxylate transporter 12-like [Rhopalosiphum padi]
MSLKKKPKEDDHEALAGEEEAVTDGQNYVLVPPDGGWGWLVLLGSTLVNMLIPGTLKSFGVLFVEFTEAFHASETAASWIPAICYFLYCSLGPVSSYLSSIYSYRTVTLIGGTLASLGLMLCYFADSITFLYFSYGMMFGCGAGLAFPPGIFIVTSYFVKYRGFANGVAISGSCLGSMFLPPFLGYLIDNYGYKEVVLILGALTLNVWVGAMLYHPVEQHMVKQYVDDCECGDDGLDSGGEVDAAASSVSLAVQAAANSVTGGKSLTELHRCGDDDEDGRHQETVSLLAQNLNGYVIVNELNASSVKVPTDDRYLLAGGGVAVIAAVKSKSTARANNCGSDSLKSLQAFSSCGLLRTTSGGAADHMQLQHHNLHYQHQHCNLQAPAFRGANGSSSLSSLRYVSTPFHGSTLVSLYEDSQPKKKQQQQQRRRRRNKRNKRRSGKQHEQSPSPSAKTDSDGDGADGQTSSRRKTVAGALQLLSDPLFIVILVSNATTAIGYTNSAILLPSYAISIGHDKSSSQYLLSVVAVLDLVGRVGGSTLSDWIRLDKRYYYLGGLVLSGVALFVLPFADDYPTMCFACAAFGLGSGVVVGITAVIMVDMLGEERLSSSYGISLFCNGLVQLIGPPVAGYIFETIGSYKPVFHGMGVILLFGASTWLVTPFLKKNHHRH